MIRKIILLASLFMAAMNVYASSHSSFLTCGQAVPTTHPNFCASFKSVATCHCTESGLPAGMCQDMNSLYARMISVFGSIQRACEYQHDTSVQNCVNDWNCFRVGGRDSTGGLCSSTGNHC